MVGAFLFGAILLHNLLFGGLVATFSLLHISLNLYNGRGIFFVSKETTSIIDRFHFWAFGVYSEIYQTMYFMGWIILMIKFAR